MLESTAAVTWLTPEAHARLHAELNGLMEARSSQQDPSDQVAGEARIRQLMGVLKGVRFHSPEDDGIIEPGMVVEACIDSLPETFLMGSREIYGDGDLQVFSEHSPLGLAILGLKPGDVAAYVAPSGRKISVSIISAKPYNLPV